MSCVQLCAQMLVGLHQRVTDSCHVCMRVCAGDLMSDARIAITETQLAFISLLSGGYNYDSTLNRLQLHGATTIRQPT